MQAILSFLQRKKPYLIGKKRLSLFRNQRKLSPREHVAQPMRLWLQGYQFAQEKDPQELATALSTLPQLEKRVMYEGAYTAYTCNDLTSNGTLKTVPEFLQTLPESFGSMYTGIGYALSLLGVSAGLRPSEIEQSWGPLTMDAYGFSEAYFNWTKVVDGHALPLGLTGTARETYDEGVGRALWLISESTPGLIRGYIEAFPQHRRCDMWAGVGVFTGFWGAADESDMKKLYKFSGKHRNYLQRGVAFGAFMRQSCGDFADYNSEACQQICNASANAILELVGEKYKVVEGNLANTSAFMKWRNDVGMVFEQN